LDLIGTAGARASAVFILLGGEKGKDSNTEDTEAGSQRAQRRGNQEGGVKPPLHGRGHRLKPVLPGGGEEYNRGHGQQTDRTDIAGDGFAFAD